MRGNIILVLLAEKNRLILGPSSTYPHGLDLVARDLDGIEPGLYARALKYLDPRNELDLDARELELEEVLSPREQDYVDFMTWKAKRDYEAVLDRRYGKDIGDCSAYTGVGMGGVTTSDSGSVEVGGVNGCTGLFFFGNGRITAAHLTAGAEEDEAEIAATKAHTDGTGEDITIIAPDRVVASQVQQAVQRTFRHARIHPQTYTERQGTSGCWVFTANEGNTQVGNEWQPSSRGSTKPPSPRPVSPKPPSPKPNSPKPPSPKPNSPKSHSGR
ncbi:MAG: hypothetical protein LQ340_006253 [Diploschistes diacapsis]|nr:MAG: hypothetical protein LQ340_006253 [Diploschistes diacapsis]